MSDIYCFLDIETTGLDPHTDYVLEVAWRFTDANYEPIGEPFSTLATVPLPAARSAMNDYVTDMHERTGLIPELEHGPTMDLRAIHSKLEEDVIMLAPAGSDVHLAGSSIHFDKSFLAERGFAGTLEHLFHHRMLDISSLKLAWRNAGEHVPVAGNRGAHRALNDVDESIAYARIFRDLIKAGAS